MTDPQPITLVYLRAGPVLATHRHFPDWRAIQDAYPDYMASLGPWTADEVEEFLIDDWGGASEAALQRLRAFVATDALTVDLTTDDPGGVSPGGVSPGG
ncbi:MAG: hypothetical protein ABIR11_07270 [Candidatus Limnocylindrales bacterium]